MDLGLKGLTALVTGGTRGIGRATCELFAREGAHVAFCARGADEVTATQAELAEHGVTALGTSLDVSDAVGVRAWVEGTAAHFGGVDLVVCSVSALAIPDTPENWEASFRTDLMGAVNTVNAALPYLRQSKHPSIVTVSSVSGREADFAAGPYGTFKTALIGYTGGLALQLAPEGIRANVVSPGNTYFPGGVWAQIEQGNPDLYNMALGMNPTGRMGKPEEMASAIVFLSSPVSSFTYGTNLVVDGALTRGLHV
ncbi:MAG: SDR family NAD(P)-dependent oxidoreductase [Actinobacteria bacterium]|nr:SDR family NAD(P)-dependent oxidoreductase [Actinomycetota bacterium]